MENRNLKESISKGNNASYWLESIGPVVFNPLVENITTDVVIVGGGIAGATIAYNLLRSGKKIVLLENENIGSSENGRTATHLKTVIDKSYINLERLYGQHETKNIADSHRAAIDYIEQIIKFENIDCEFEHLDGYLFLHPSGKKKSLIKELRACKNAGIDAVELPFVLGTNEHIPCLKFYNQAQFHPVKYLKGLCDAIVRMGGSIYTETYTDKIDQDGIYTDNGFKVNAKHVVITSNSFSEDKHLTDFKQATYQTYVIGARVKKNSIRKSLWWDTGDRSANSKMPPYHYVRVQKFDDEYDLLICGGEDQHFDNNKANQKAQYLLLEEWLSQRFPIIDVIYRWSAQVREPINGIGYIGKDPKQNNLYLVSGGSGNGMTHSTIAGVLIPDLINGKENKWSNTYDPDRFLNFSSKKALFKSIMNDVISFFKNGLHDLKLPKVIAKVIALGEKNIRGNNKITPEDSSLECLTQWNNDEESWDFHKAKYGSENKMTGGHSAAGHANINFNHHSER